MTEVPKRKIPRPTGLPVRIGRCTAMPAESTTTCLMPPLATRRGSLSRPLAANLRFSRLPRDVKSVHNIAELACETTCVRKTASLQSLKPPGEAKRKLEEAETPPASRPKLTATSPTGPFSFPDCLPSTNAQLNEFMMEESSQSRQSLTSESGYICPSSVVAECEKIVQTLHAKASRNSNEFDDSVASFLSGQTDLLDVRLDISIASVPSEPVDRTPSVEDLPMECEAVTPGAVISAMSLDTGYQGDGELSRPESRNAESEARSLKVQPQDEVKTTMTDSDFFTESDADGHDEAGLNKRDRKAQVIDGTLYGGPASERSQTEDMESSGIYSDLERKPDPPAYQELISQQIRNIQSIVLCQKEAAVVQQGMVNSSSGDSSSTIQEIPTAKGSPSPTERKDTIRKAVTPRDADVKTKVQPKTRAPKRGKWDEVMKKISQPDKQEKPELRFRDVKSRVYQTLTPRGASGGNTPPLDAGKTRSRRSTRVRTSESSLVSPKSKQSRTSAASTPHSSISDLSVSCALPAASRVGKKRDVQPTIVATATKENTISRVSSARVKENNVGIQNNNRTSTVSNGNVKAPAGRRPMTPRLQSAPLKDVNQNGVFNKSSTHTLSTQSTLNNNNINCKTKISPRLNKSSSLPRSGIQRLPRENIAALRKELSDSQRAVEAMAALLKYCTQDLDAFNGPLVKRELALAELKAKTSEDKLHMIDLAYRELQDKLCQAEDSIVTLTEKETTIQSHLEVEKKKSDSLIEQLDEYRTNCQKLEEEVKKIQDTSRTDLELEKTKVSNLFEQLESAQLNCKRLEEECAAIRQQTKKMEEEQVCYRTQIQNLISLKTELNRVQSLQGQSEMSLLEYQKLNESLTVRLHDKECEIKMLTADNAQMRKRLSNMTLESDELKDTISQLENLNVRSQNHREVVDRLCQSNVDTMSSGDVLVSEVESLRQVLALKTTEVSELRRQELHLRVQADRVPQLVSQVTTLEAKVEDLQSQLSSQIDLVRSLSKSKDLLEEEIKTVSAQRLRLSQKNEELQYKLKVNSQAMIQLAKDRPIDSSAISTPSKKIDDTRPQMMGVVEKSDSVSYILDMGEDTQEVLESIVRRAENARSQTLPKKKSRSRLATSCDGSADYFTCPDSSADSPGFISPAMTPRRPNHHSRNCVRLLQTDFASDSIELPREADCEVIEISGSFDRPEPDMSCSTSSNSSSNFDIESEKFRRSSSQLLLRKLKGKRVHDQIRDDGPYHFLRKSGKYNNIPELTIIKH